MTNIAARALNTFLDGIAEVGVDRGLIKNKKALSSLIEKKATEICVPGIVNRNFNNSWTIRAAGNRTSIITLRSSDLKSDKLLIYYYYYYLNLMRFQYSAFHS